MVSPQNWDDPANEGKLRFMLSYLDEFIEFLRTQKNQHVEKEVLKSSIDKFLSRPNAKIESNAVTPYMHQHQLQIIGNESGAKAQVPGHSWNIMWKNPLQEKFQFASLPKDFGFPEITENSGLTDPESHLKIYTVRMMLYSPDDLMDMIFCKCFAITLVDDALDWYFSLPPRSIGSFSQLGGMFLQRFAGSRIHKKPSVHLYTIRQRPGEQLSAYLKRFNDETFRVTKLSEEKYIDAFCNGLLPGRYSEELDVLEPETKEELFEKVFKWIKCEDYENSKREVRQLEEREKSLRIDNTSAASGETSSCYMSKRRRHEETLWSGSRDCCTLEFDGASKGNPGQAGAGAVIRADDGSLICRLREGLGIATCNTAEYRAIILGLKYALDKGFTSIRVRGDSKLVCMQIQGIWKVRNRNIWSLYEEAKDLEDRFLSFKITQVSRDSNFEADEQANLATNLPYGRIQEDVD